MLRLFGKILTSLPSLFPYGPQAIELSSSHILIAQRSGDVLLGDWAGYSSGIKPHDNVGEREYIDGVIRG